MAGDGEPPGKRLKVDFNHHISIGRPDDERRTYPVPSNLICERSRRVDAHYKKHPFSTFKTKKPHHHETFGHYLTLLHYDHLDFTDKNGKEPKFHVVLLDLRQLYDLVVEMEDHVSLNLISDTLVRYLRRKGEDGQVGFDYLTVELVIAYGEYGEDSPLQRVLMRFAAFQMGHEEFREAVFERDAATEIAAEMLRNHFQAVVAGEAAFAECDEKEFHVDEKYFG